MGEIHRKYWCEDGDELVDSGGHFFFPELEAMDGEYQVDILNHHPAPFLSEAAALGLAKSGGGVVVSSSQAGGGNAGGSRVGASTNDQRFLLVFIFGAYFGPDLRNEVPRKSALQRIAHRLPIYTSDDLGGSVFKLSEMESIYYYALRHSHPSARVKLQSLYKFLQGHLAPPVREALEDDRQFTTFFPPHLHRQSRYKGTYKVVESMVFINEPELSYMKLEDIERFKRLTGLSDLTMDRDLARSFQHGQRNDRDEERQARFYALAEARGPLGVDQDGRPLPHVLPDPNLESRKKRKKREQAEASLAAVTDLTQRDDRTSATQWPPSSQMPAAAMLLIPSLPTVEQWNRIVDAARPSIVLTGTAAARQSGPLVGLVDIGVADDAYLFRAALPGVKKDEGDFNCEVECDGKVTIKGMTTTGESRIFRTNRMFHMQTQYLCPPGPFSVSFNLPGPVEPNQFTGTFGSDGVLEGIVMKARVRSGAACLTFEP
ncbi:increased DNA methylation 2 [Selaginella moellendorffii]|uniref:increased DNA methylation 2 n=1 Tax=Selaginella moellendorffii TaxID=88036 RepID=UPI000D1CB0B7|nr:increased DNA methylation 2 [Selaginella moellendorffii]|eukprot:XP_024544461.1 increased DNA methylation 2 [Selaginella moellendorffii]